jgi:cell division protein ZapE
MYRQQTETGMTPIEEYEARIKSGALQDDPAQRLALASLSNLYHDIEDYKPRSKWMLSGLFGAGKPRPKGLYMYGGVGRGKSMLMDLFFDTAHIERKRRVHFHAFMQDIHSAMHEARAEGIANPIKAVGDQVVKTASLLCFDEMQITDITDAMIVGRLFEHLFDAGVIVVTTSNRHPDDLYKDGLNRHLFLPFIDEIKLRLVLHNLDSETDHRQNRLSGQKVYFSPLHDENRSELDNLWAALAPNPEPLKMSRKGRTIELPFYDNGVGRASFDDLCAKPLGPGDYIMIAQSVRALFLTDIPKLSRENANEAKRFVTLIDALYEAGVRLIASADAPPEDLYEQGTGAFEFVRTASRLREMQSVDWSDN